MALNRITAENRSKLGKVLKNNLPVYSGDVNPIIDKLNKYKVYTALLTQTGTDAPVATVLENTIGDIVWTRDTSGQYRATLSNSFTSDKTVLFATGNSGGDGWVFFIDSSGVPNYIVLVQYDSIGNTVDNCQCQIEIRVYN